MRDGARVPGQHGQFSEEQPLRPAQAEALLTSAPGRTSGSAAFGTTDLAQTPPPSPRAADTLPVGTAPDPVLAATDLGAAAAAFSNKWGLTLRVEEWNDNLALLQEVHRVFLLAPAAHVDVSALLGVRRRELGNMDGKYDTGHNDQTISIDDDVAVPSSQTMGARLDLVRVLSQTELEVATTLALRQGEELTVRSSSPEREARIRVRSITSTDSTAQTSTTPEAQPAGAVLRVTLEQAPPFELQPWHELFRSPPITLAGLGWLVLHELGHAVEYTMGVENSSNKLAKLVGMSKPASALWATRAMRGHWGEVPENVRSSVVALFGNNTLVRQPLEQALPESLPHREALLANPTLRELARAMHGSTPRGDVEQGAVIASEADGGDPAGDYVYYYVSAPLSAPLRVLRSHAVQRTSNYSLAAPNELFAEAYVAFYADYGNVPEDRLGEKIPDANVRSWFRSEVHENPQLGRRHADLRAKAP